MLIESLALSFGAALGRDFNRVQNDAGHSVAHSTLDEPALIDGHTCVHSGITELRPRVLTRR